MAHGFFLFRSAFLTLRTQKMHLKQTAFFIAKEVWNVEGKCKASKRPDGYASWSWRPSQVISMPWRVGSDCATVITAMLNIIIFDTWIQVCALRIAGVNDCSVASLQPHYHFSTRWMIVTASPDPGHLQPAPQAAVAEPTAYSMQQMSWESFSTQLPMF